jgi:hypothetical protein
MTNRVTLAAAGIVRLSRSASAPTRSNRRRSPMKSTPDRPSPPVPSLSPRARRSSARSPMERCGRSVKEATALPV